MMKRIKKILSVIFCISIIASVFSGCGSKDELIDFIYPFNADITSFDPQIASKSDEFLIIENCFEGLVRVRDDGTVMPGVAESWSVSDDGLTYTFKLKQGVKWRIKEDSSITELMGDDFNPDITASDFVFALQRAVYSVTDAPLFSSVANIVNATKIHNGKANLNQLGVKAVDDYTLEIKLTNPDDAFINVLDSAIAMPCNEDFFNATKGRYGLGLGYIMFNGQFYVNSILESSYILKNNNMYTGSTPSAISDITLRIINEDSDIPKNLKSGYYDSAYISGAEYNALNDDSITVEPYTNKLWGFVLNKNKQILSNKKLRHAVCLSVSPSTVENSTYLKSATSITTPSCIVDNKPSNEILNTVEKPDSQKAIKLWKEGLNEERFTSANLTVIASEDMADMAKQLVQGIQGSIGTITTYGDENKISFSLKIDILSQEDFNIAYSKGEYDIALKSFTSTSNSASAFLKDIYSSGIFTSNNNIKYAIKNAEGTASPNQAGSIKKAEKEMLNDYTLLPIVFESSYYAQAKGVSGVDFHAGSGKVCFVYATREK